MAEQITKAEIKQLMADSNETLEKVYREGWNDAVEAVLAIEREPPPRPFMMPDEVFTDFLDRISALKKPLPSP